jgi:hypothetical protein
MATRTTTPIEGKQSMNYLQYAFYAINIYLENVIFVGEIPVGRARAIWPRAQIWCVSDTGSAKRLYLNSDRLRRFLLVSAGLLYVDG